MAVSLKDIRDTIRSIGDDEYALDVIINRISSLPTMDKIGSLKHSKKRITRDLDDFFTIGGDDEDQMESNFYDLGNDEEVAFSLDDLVTPPKDLQYTSNEDEWLKSLVEIGEPDVPF